MFRHPDFIERCILTTDASDIAVGAVLSQRPIGEDRTIAFMSKIMKPAEKNYTTTEKECLAVFYAILHFRPYLFGRPFTVICDHEPLKRIASVKPPSQRLIRWRTRLREYEYEFLHRIGETNVNADALLRNPIPELAVLLPFKTENKSNPMGVRTRSATFLAAAEVSKRKVFELPPNATVRNRPNTNLFRRTLSALTPTKPSTSTGKRPVGRPPDKQTQKLGSE